MQVTNANQSLQFGLSRPGRFIAAASGLLAACALAPAGVAQQNPPHSTLPAEPDRLFLAGTVSPGIPAHRETQDIWYPLRSPQDGRPCFPEGPRCTPPLPNHLGGHVVPFTPQSDE